MLSERPDTHSLRQVLSNESALTQAVLAIGPEGGWTDAEFAAAQASGFREASLGKLILRTETAVAAALAVAGQCLGKSDRVRSAVGGVADAIDYPLREQSGAGPGLPTARADRVPPPAVATAALPPVPATPANGARPRNSAVGATRCYSPF